MIKRTIFVLLSFLALLPGCAAAEENPLDIALIVRDSPHKVIVWVNNEPLAVCRPFTNCVKPIKLITKKGANQIRFTTQNTTEDTAPTTIRILQGSWFKPDEIKTLFEWTSTQATETSPLFDFQNRQNYFPDLSAYDDLNLSDADAHALVQKTYRDVFEALKKKDLQRLGVSEKELDAFMQSLMGTDNFAAKVFHADSYEVTATAQKDDIGILVGKKIILAYNTQGNAIFQAGPNSRDFKNGEMQLSFLVESLLLGKKDNQWQLIFPYEH